MTYITYLTKWTKSKSAFLNVYSEIITVNKDNFPIINTYCYEKLLFSLGKSWLRKIPMFEKSYKIDDSCLFMVEKIKL